MSETISSTFWNCAKNNLSPSPSKQETNNYKQNKISFTDLGGVASDAGFRFSNVVSLALLIGV